MMLVGIDPDMKGGLALIRQPEREVVMLRRMPILPAKPPVRRTDELDIEGLFGILNEMRRAGGERVILEAATVRAQKGAGGADRMMGGVGRVFTNYGVVLSAASIVFGRKSIVDAHPSAWKRKMGLSSDKALSRERACNAYPDHVKLFGRVVNTGLAEAALLTEWGLGQCTRVH